MRRRPLLPSLAVMKMFHPDRLSCARRASLSPERRRLPAEARPSHQSSPPPGSPPSPRVPPTAAVLPPAAQKHPAAIFSRSVLCLFSFLCLDFRAAVVTTRGGWKAPLPPPLSGGRVSSACWEVMVLLRTEKRPSVRELLCPCAASDPGG